MKKISIIGLLFTLLFGTLLHFTYEWSAYSALAGTISAINESTWEHTKMLVFPMLIYGVFEYFYYGKSKVNFIPIRLLSILLGVAIIIGGFYTYTGITGKDYPVADILLFVIAVLAAYVYGYRLMHTKKYSSPGAHIWSIIGLLVLITAYAAFTFFPPHINLFLDPITGTYGVIG